MAAVQQAIGQQSRATLHAPVLHPSVYPHTSSYAQAFYESYANDTYDHGWNELEDEFPTVFQHSTNSICSFS